MFRIYAIYIIIYMSVFSAGSLSTLFCNMVSCGQQALMVCTIAKGSTEAFSYTMMVSRAGNSDHNTPESNCQSPKSPAQPCCSFCNPNCCQYLVPEIIFPFWQTVPAEWTGRPLGKQNHFEQSFHPAIWHPPAA